MSERLVGKTIDCIGSDGHEYKGLVSGLDYEVGLTIDYFDGSERPSWSEPDAHAFCLNRQESAEEGEIKRYETNFKYMVQAIKKGSYSAPDRCKRIDGEAKGGEQPSCAFQ